VSDPRWTDETRDRLAEHYETGSPYAEMWGIHKDLADATLRWLADHGLLVTPQIREVVEAAQRMERHWRMPSRPGSLGYDEAGHRAKAMLIHAVRNHLAAVDTYEATREERQ